MPPLRCGLPNPKNTLLLLCDIQEKFRPLIWKFPAVVSSAQALHQTAKVLGMETVVTEQNPGRLGGTVAELEGLPPALPKMLFSMLTKESRDLISSWGPAFVPKHAILCGIEAHVCVQQTALDLLERDVQVHIVVDGVSSQRRGDRAVALANLVAAGAAVTTTEAIIFQLLATAEHPNFKEVQKIVIGHNKRVAEGSEEGRGLDVMA